MTSATATTVTAFEVRVVPPDEYFADAGGWDALVRRCDAEALFMSHAWQSEWWNAFGPRLGLEPRMVLVERGGTVVARAAFFQRRLRDRGVPVRTLELLGNVWRGPATFRSEFLDVLIDPEVAPDVRPLLVQVVERLDWNECVLLDLDQGSGFARALTEGAIRATLVRRLAEECSYEVHLSQGIETYRASLAPAVRRKMFGQRTKLERLQGGALRLRRTEAFDELDRLHSARWGSGLLGNGRSQFLAGLQRRLPRGALHVSLMCAGDAVVSALLNVEGTDGRLYNLQGGFDADAFRGLSPARLHWGLLMEQGATESRSFVIDLLVGGGRSDDYKRDMAQPGRRSLSLQLVRGLPLTWMYRARDALRAHRGRSA